MEESQARDGREQSAHRALSTQSLQELALSHGCALPGREPFLIGNLPRRLFPRFSARIAPQRGMPVMLPVSRVHAVRSVGMGSRSLYGRR